MDLIGAEFDQLRQAGDLEAAETAIDALEAVSRLLGASLRDSHPQALLARANYATTALDLALDRSDLGEARRSAALLGEAEAALCRARGSHHPDVINVGSNLAVARVEVAKSAGDASALRAAVDGLRAAREAARAAGCPVAITETDLGNAALELALLDPTREFIDDAIRVNEDAVRHLDEDDPSGKQAASQLRECLRIRELSERAEAATDDEICSAVLAEVYLYLDLECGGERRQIIEEHLDGCVNCRREYGLAQAAMALVARCCGDERAPRDLRLRIMERIAGSVRAEAFKDL